MSEVKSGGSEETRLREELAETQRQLADARFRPMGDNHHNAAQCPHCGDPLRAATARATAAERERDEARAELARNKEREDCLLSDSYACEREQRARATAAESALAEARGALKNRKALDDYAWKHCTHNQGRGHDSWVICRECVLSYLRAALARTGEQETDRTKKRIERMESGDVAVGAVGGAVRESRPVLEAIAAALREKAAAEDRHESGATTPPPGEQGKGGGEGLREALEFYADPETYFAIGFFPDRPCGAFMDDFSECWDECRGKNVQRPGKRARAAIASLPLESRDCPEVKGRGTHWPLVPGAECVGCGAIIPGSLAPAQPAEHPAKVVCDFQKEPHYPVERPTPCLNPRPAKVENTTGTLMPSDDTGMY